jgi:RNase H-fold protein (predicted Holliday junction resolvase)
VDMIAATLILQGFLDYRANKAAGQTADSIG